MRNSGFGVYKNSVEREGFMFKKSLVSGSLVFLWAALIMLTGCEGPAGQPGLTGKIGPRGENSTVPGSGGSTGAAGSAGTSTVSGTISGAVLQSVVDIAVFGGGAIVMGAVTIDSGSVDLKNAKIVVVGNVKVEQNVVINGLNANFTWSGGKFVSKNAGAVFIGRPADFAYVDFSGSASKAGFIVTEFNTYFAKNSGKLAVAVTNLSDTDITAASLPAGKTVFILGAFKVNNDIDLDAAGGGGKIFVMGSLKTTKAVKVSTTADIKIDIIETGGGDLTFEKTGSTFTVNTLTSTAKENILLPNNVKNITIKGGNAGVISGAAVLGDSFFGNTGGTTFPANLKLEGGAKITINREASFGGTIDGDSQEGSVLILNGKTAITGAITPKHSPEGITIGGTGKVTLSAAPDIQTGPLKIANTSGVVLAAGITAGNINTLTITGGAVLIPGDSEKPIILNAAAGSGLTLNKGDKLLLSNGSTIKSANNGRIEVGAVTTITAKSGSWTAAAAGKDDVISIGLDSSGLITTIAALGADGNSTANGGSLAGTNGALITQLSAAGNNLIIAKNTTINLKGGGVSEGKILLTHGAINPGRLTLAKAVSSKIITGVMPDLTVAYQGNGAHSNLHGKLKDPVIKNVDLSLGPAPDLYLAGFTASRDGGTITADSSNDCDIDGAKNNS
jgi:hypothetical protein